MNYTLHIPLEHLPRMVSGELAGLETTRSLACSFNSCFVLQALCNCMFVPVSSPQIFLSSFHFASCLCAVSPSVPSLSPLLPKAAVLVHNTVSHSLPMPPYSQFRVRSHITISYQVFKPDRFSNIALWRNFLRFF